MSEAKYIELPKEAKRDHLQGPRSRYYKVTVEEITIVPRLYKAWGVIKTVKEEVSGYYDQPRTESIQQTIYTQELSEIDLRKIIGAINNLQV